MNEREIAELYRLIEQLRAENRRLERLAQYSQNWLNLERELAKVYMTVETMADTHGIPLDALFAVS